MKRIIRVFLLVLVLFMVASCRKDSKEGIGSFSANIGVGEVVEIDLVGMESSQVTFSNEDPTIAKVDDDGNVMGLKPGFTTVTIQKGKKSWSFFVTVTGQALNIDLVESYMDLTIDEVKEIDVNTNDRNGLSYVSQNPEIATVSSDGKVTGVSAGTAEVLIKSNTNPDVSQTLTVKVFMGIFIDVDLEVELLDNETLQLDVNSNDHLGLTFTSSNQNILTVDAEGLITGVSPGVATVTITSKFDKDVKKVVNVTILNHLAAIFNQIIANTVDLDNYTLKIATKELIDDKNIFNVIRLMFDGNARKLEAGHIVEYFELVDNKEYRYYQDGAIYTKEEITNPLYEKFLLYEDFAYEFFTLKSNNKYSLNFEKYNLLDKFISLFDDNGTILNFELVMGENYISAMNFDLYFNDNVLVLSIEIINVNETTVEVPSDV